MTTTTGLRSRKNPPPPNLDDDSSAPELPELPKVPAPAFISQSQIYALIFIAAVVIHGTLYSLRFNTSTAPSPSASSLQAGDLPPSSMPQVASYFAQKNNVFNYLFAKKAWFWTTLVFISHLFTTPNLLSYPLLSPSSSPSSSRPPLLKGYQSPRRRIAKYLAATTFWILLTIWMVGPGLFERTMVWSGGECSLAVPEEVCSGLVDCQGVINTALVRQGAEQGMAFVTVPTRFCTTRTPITPKTFPALFLTGSDRNGGGETSTLSSRWTHLRPHWSGGHDVSGHVFLLTMSALLMIDQCVPTVLLMLQDPKKLDQPGGKTSLWPHKVTAVVGMAFAGLWVFILSKTAMYFHTALEKASGMALAIVGLVIFQYVGALIQD